MLLWEQLITRRRRCIWGSLIQRTDTAMPEVVAKTRRHWVIRINRSCKGIISLAKTFGSARGVIPVCPGVTPIEYARMTATYMNVMITVVHVVKWGANTLNSGQCASDLHSLPYLLCKFTAFPEASHLTTILSHSSPTIKIKNNCVTGYKLTEEAW